MIIDIRPDNTPIRAPKFIDPKNRDLIHMPETLSPDFFKELSTIIRENVSVIEYMKEEPRVEFDDFPRTNITPKISIDINPSVSYTEDSFKSFSRSVGYSKAKGIIVETILDGAANATASYMAVQGTHGHRLMTATSSQIIDASHRGFPHIHEAHTRFSPADIKYIQDKGIVPLNANECLHFKLCDQIISKTK